MAAAADCEAATVFLETSLGTRLVLSFPSSATTVADLKRRVRAEHAACFPEAGPIAVKSLQVKHEGSLFHLADSMAVEAAFRWVKGPWNLLAEARPLARGDADCRSCGGSEQNAVTPVVSDSSAQNMSPRAVADGGSDLAIGDDGFSDTPLLNQMDGNGASDQLEGVEKHAVGQQKGGIVKAILQECSGPYLAIGSCDNPIDLEDTSSEGVNHVSGQPEDGNVKTMLQESCSDLDSAAGESEPRAKSQMDKSCKDAEHASSQYKGGNAKAMLEGSSDPDVAADEGETPSLSRQDKSHEGVKHAWGQHKNGDVKAMFQENSNLGVAAGEGEIPPMDHMDKIHESVQHASRQCKDGNVNTVPEESSEFDVTASESETLTMTQMDKPREDFRHDSEQHKDGIVNIMPKKSSDLDKSAAAKDLPMQGQQKDFIAEPRGMELFRTEDKNDENTTANCYDNISSLASTTATINLAQEKRSRIQQENLNSDPLAFNQGSCSHGMGKKPSHDQKEAWTSGESRNNGSDIPTCVQSMDRDNSTHKGDEEEPWVAGLSSGESSSKDTDVPHCVKSMKEGNERPGSSDRFLRKRKYEGATSTISKEQESCFMTRQQRVLSMRKVPMSRAAKIYGLRC